MGLVVVDFCFISVRRSKSYSGENGTLAEWLTRCPAKAIPSGACVRITQVSHHLLFASFLLGRTPPPANSECS
ncbi:hypothetical protein M8818_004478 [Zalaria obscura]|uniref:Uncharacterized protein n=1 Tax=Zalaria obscura TaxID=2024903 RepID=A0ACC3SFL3_9PEZI